MKRTFFGFAAVVLVAIPAIPQEVAAKQEQVNIDLRSAPAAQLSGFRRTQESLDKLSQYFNLQRNTGGLPTGIIGDEGGITGRLPTGIIGDEGGITGRLPTGGGIVGISLNENLNLSKFQEMRDIAHEFKNISPNDVPKMLEKLISFFGRKQTTGFTGSGSSSGNEQNRPIADEVGPPAAPIVTKEAVERYVQSEERTLREQFGRNPDPKSPNFNDREAYVMAKEIGVMNALRDRSVNVSDNLGEPRSYVAYVLGSEQNGEAAQQGVLQTQGLLQSTRQLNYTMLKMLEEQAITNYILTRAMQQMNRMSQASITNAEIERANEQVGRARSGDALGTFGPIR